ncbi:hypothetical protein B0H11DRAFT_1904173 [Mycena galericulata]|nr:hypothetical protein B0H11DRAFT_1904173 [Mycena galericulata]
MLNALVFERHAKVSSGTELGVPMELRMPCACCRRMRRPFNSSTLKESNSPQSLEQIENAGLPFLKNSLAPVLLLPVFWSRKTYNLKTPAGASRLPSQRTIASFPQVQQKAIFVAYSSWPPQNPTPIVPPTLLALSCATGTSHLPHAGSESVTCRPVLPLPPPYRFSGWAKFRFTPELFRYVYMEFLPELMVHLKSRDDE